MKRWLKYAIIVVLLACLAAGAGALGWLLGTRDGARWLMDAISRHTPYKISARRVEGRICNDLRLEGARVQWPTGNAGMGFMRFHWQPVFLLMGKVAISDLDLKDVRINDNRPVSKVPPQLVWPRVAGLPAWLNMRVGQFRIDGLEYRHAGKPPVNVTGASARITWQGSLLTVWNLALKTPSMHADGALMAGFRRPTLLLRINAGPVRPVAGVDGLSCEARLFPGRDPEQMAGPVRITGLSGGKRFLGFAGEVGITRNSVNLRKMRLERSGRRGTVNGDGALILGGKKPLVRLHLSFTGVDLSRELNAATILSGALSVDGNTDDYRGKFSLSNSAAGWRAGRVSGAFHGDESGAGLTALEGRVLGGTVSGDGRVDWRKGLAVSGSLRGRNLDPAKVSPQWKGVVNMDLSGSAAWYRSEPPRADLAGRLLESRLHGKALTGDADVSLRGDNLLIRRMALHGKGFDIRAEGELRNRLDFDAQVGNLSGLIPGTAGKLSATGWVRWHDKRLSGSVAGTGRSLGAAGLSAGSADFAADLSEGPGYPMRISFAAKNLASRQLHLDSASLTASGSLERHMISAAVRAPGFQASATLSGGYGKGAWAGWITGLSGRDTVGPWNMQAPTALRVSADSISISRLSLNGVGGEHLDADGRITLHPLLGYIRTEWRSLNLVRLSGLPGATGLTGISSGTAQVRWPGGGRLLMNGRVDAAGTMMAGGNRISVRQASARIDWNDRGMLSQFDIRLADGGTLKGRFTSPEPAGVGMPSRGSLDADLQGFDVAFIHVWLPAGLDLTGLLSGKVKGDFLPGNRLDLKGNAKLSRGAVTWTNTSGRFNAKLKTAEASWAWQGDRLTGDVSLALEEYGQARGSFRVPLAARLPAAVDPAGPVMVNVSATAMETGLLTSLFPGLIQESRGELKLDARAGGQWQKPDITGNLRLDKASAYLPTAGVKLKNVQLAAHFVGDRLVVDSFEVDSGPGRIGGTGAIRLKNGRIADYQGTIKGDRFQVVYLPDLQVLANPDLKFSGTPGKIAVRGDIVVPELLVNEQQSRAPIQPSEDVLIEGETGAGQKKAGLPLDIQVTVTLGDKVQLKLQGIEAQLKGSLKLVMQRLDEIRSTGEIRVVKGKYKTYGISLDITRGRVYYAGGPINQPTLDIQALRKVGDVRAGVTIAGTPRTMAVKLYSEPNMPDGTILSYIILGQPLAYTGEQSGLVTRAAGQLLTSTSGYKPIQVTPPGVAPSKAAGATLSQSVVSVGRYLTPKLYISYGRSLLTSANLVRMRYDLSRHWEVETQTGTESGGDLFFKIIFK